MGRHVEDYDELYDMLLLAEKLEEDIVISRVIKRAQLRIGRLESAIEKLQHENDNLKILLAKARQGES